MLDDALKQLAQEKQQVEMLNKQVAVSEQQLQSEKAKKAIPVKRADDLSDEYKRMKAEVENWRAVVQQREFQYEKVKRELDNLVAQLGNFNIEVVKNKLGEIERITNLNAKTDNQAEAKIPQYDSLMKLLDYERSNNSQNVDRLKRSVAAYSREIKKWKKKFSENGIYLPERYTQITLSMLADSSSKAALKVRMKATRSAEKLRATSLDFSLMCKLPNGNLVNLYKGGLIFQKNITQVNIDDINSPPIDTNGWYEFIGYINNKEAYYEDLYISK
ncbi:MAG: hypothetical protein EAZ57_03185 [Cytophagales bacterium]|nr:MAG: hypothetical protein EAZ57_03185 [Cytophagales bacterium]